MRFIDEVEGLPRMAMRLPDGNLAGDSVSTEALEDSILAGLDLHDSIKRLAWRGHLHDQLMDLLNRSAAKTERPERWRECVESDLPRALRSAAAKHDEEARKRLAAFGAPPLPVTPVLPGLPVLKPNAFAVMPLRKRAWVIEPIIPLGETTLFYGPGATGKSLLLLQLGLGMAGGIHWLGKPVRPARTLMFTCEDDADEINRRSVKVLRALGITWEHCAGNFAAIPMRGTDASAVLAIANKDGTLAATATYEALKAVVSDFRPDVVIIDTLADVFAGNENDRSHAKQFIKLIERLGPCTFIVTAHPSVSGQADGRGASGSTGWPAAVRSHLYLERPRGEDGVAADPDLRTLSNMKSNYAQAGSGALEMRWIEGVFQAVEGVSSDTGANVDDVFIGLLERYTAQGRLVNASGGSTYAPAVFAKDERARSAGATKRTLVAAMNRLLESERIVVASRKVSGHERRFLTVADTSRDPLAPPSLPPV